MMLVPPEALERQLNDERERDAAITDDAALIAYERKWKSRLAKLQRRYPARWSMQGGLSDEELRDELTLRLIDAVRTKPEERANPKYQRPGKEWGLLYCIEQRRLIRKDFTLKIIPTDPALHHLALHSPLLLRDPNDEERMIEDESRVAFETARTRAESGLSRPQRQWLAALKMTANAGRFFEASGKINLSAASRMLEKNRSSAVRAFDELQSCFARELKKVSE